ncbi:MAG: alpha/beta hydrolase [Methylocella sp.]
MLRPDRFRGVIALSVPLTAHPPVPPTTFMPQNDDALFYFLYFQKPGVAEEELERDVRFTIRNLLFWASGDAGPRSGNNANPNPFGMVRRTGGLFASLPKPPSLPIWLTEADVDFYAGEFAKTGFRGGLNWYRNFDRNWELLSSLNGAKVTVPALYVTGDRDIVLDFPGMRQAVADLSHAVPMLRKTMVLPECGHWTQQERPEEVNAAMIDFLRRL